MADKFTPEQIVLLVGASADAVELLGGSKHNLNERGREFLAFYQTQFLAALHDRGLIDLQDVGSAIAQAVTRSPWTAPPGFDDARQCPDCCGTGTEFAEAPACPRCHGYGALEAAETDAEARARMEHPMRKHRTRPT